MHQYIVYRLDRRDGQAADIRTRARPLHRDYMAQFAARVRIGGPILGADGQACGGMMVIDAASEAEVRAIVERDPFELAGLSEHIHIHPFRWQTQRPADLPPL